MPTPDLRDSSGKRPPSTIRRWIEAVYAFDDHQWDRWETFLTASPRGILLQAVVVFSGIFALLALVWVLFAEARGTTATLAGVIAAVGIYASVAVRREMRRRLLTQRREAHQCLTCGYDLRESRERCPECGTATNCRFR